MEDKSITGPQYRELEIKALRVNIEKTPNILYGLSGMTMMCQKRRGETSGITGYVLKANKKREENVMVMERMGGRMTVGGMKIG